MAETAGLLLHFIFTKNNKLWLLLKTRA